MANCSLCRKPIKLVPSAKERAIRYGGTPEYYEKLFNTHMLCQIAKREKDTAALLQKDHYEQTKL